MILPFNALRIFRYPFFCLICLFLGMGAASSTRAQTVAEKQGQTFVVQKVGKLYTIETVARTLEAANLSAYRFQQTSNILTLDDGTEIEILSAQTLAALGLVADVSAYKKAYPEKHVPSKFSIKKYILLEQRPTRIPDK